MSSMASSSRRGVKVAEAAAAKERRQRIIVIAAAVVLGLILVYEIPHTLHLLSGGSSTPAPAAIPAVTPSTSPATTVPGSLANTSAALRKALRQPERDIFVATPEKGEVTFGSIPNPPGLHDPFASPSSPEAQTAPPARPPVTVSQLPGTIVIGAPGAGRVAEHGWIVILASIPTARGRAAATSFAKAAQQKGVGGVSILNSSNRKPLRGGYWVVYTGPFATLATVNQHAAAVHGGGFPSAYIRQLLVYRKKG
jgi:hypothetical protein